MSQGEGDIYCLIDLQYHETFKTPTLGNLKQMLRPFPV